MKSSTDEEGQQSGSTKNDTENNMAATIASLQREHMEYRNTSKDEAKGEGCSSSRPGVAEAGRRPSAGDIPYEDLPKALIATNVPDAVFLDAQKKKSFEDLFCAFGENVHFVYLSSFRRVRIGYETPEQVVRARIGMHKKEIYGTTLSLYFLQPVKLSNSSSLEPPIPTKQHLLSPPASPPVGWEPKQESEPVIDYDVLAALASLAPGEAHELHAADDNKPGIFVLPCEDPPPKGAAARGPKMKIQHTRRPEPS
ncbi:calcipressin-1-like [Asterias rubens]|uniref:calcipressin-1-like n=1 Tax=Asterias rubens TaxID=7604 RepID=UPI00145519E2|nr:calcipressin-1-like [Asterias rubens]